MKLKTLIIMAILSLLFAVLSIAYHCYINRPQKPFEYSETIVLNFEKASYLTSLYFISLPSLHLIMLFRL